MTVKRSYLMPVVVAALALASGGWFLQRGASQERNVYFQSRLFEEVIQHVSERYVDETSPSDLYRKAIDGLLRELGDPHTTFMTAEDYDRLRVQTQGEYGGLGIEINVRDGWLTVVAPLPSSPAERAGLRGGDRIIEVDGESTRGWSSDDGVANLRGPKGKPVDLKVMRVGTDEPLSFRVVRDEIQIQAVPTAYVMDNEIGYIQLRSFSEHSTDEVRRAIDRFRNEGMRGLILDLRQNPGGLLEQGIALSDLFVERGQVVAETRSRISQQSQSFRASRGEQYGDMPIVVLVSPASASAAEILAGALQDHDRAVVVGLPTFGKGSVQTLFPLSGGNYLKLTTARWYTPLGRSITREETDEELEALAEAAGDDFIEALIQHAKEKGQQFTTEAGRIVYGGGGIHPDIIARGGEMTDAEREFNRARAPHMSTYEDLLHRFAVHYSHEHELERGFAVTEAMLDRFYGMLIEEGIEVDREVYDEVSHLVARDLGHRTTYTLWGGDEAQKRWNLDDPQVRVAIDLLLEASDPASLITAAEAYRERQEAARSARAGHASGAGPQR